MAAETGFSITAKSSYSEKSTGNLKGDTNQLAHVDWNYSSEESHKEWFKVVNSNGDSRSDSMLLNYLSSKNIPESGCSYNYYYYLMARREHILNPRTTVTGKWES